VTVVGPELARADAYATAAFAMGVEGLKWLEQVEGYDALLVTTDAEARRTSGWPGSA
jgi:thiamine biosynthesis lipoprotein